jgi:predicted TIM-barrel fold metal-dependent hydrolase
MVRKQPTGRLIAFVVLSVVLARRGNAQEAPLADHHQHLFSPAVVAAGETMQQITVDDLIAHLDAAGIRRAVVLSLGYILGVPNKTAQDEYDKVKAENDWTSSQVARFPDRLVGFCSVNPLKEYAFDELARCAKDTARKTTPAAVANTTARPNTPSP